MRTALKRHTSRIPGVLLGTALVLFGGCISREGLLAALADDLALATAAAARGFLAGTLTQSL